MVTSFDILVDAVALVFLTVFAVQDWARRDISDSLVYLFTAISFSSFIANMARGVCSPPVYLIPSLVVDGLVILMVYVLYSLGMIGKGDVFVVAALTLLFPCPGAGASLHGTVFLPPIITIILYSTGFIVGYSILKLVYNLLFNHEGLREVPGKYRALYALMGSRMRIGQYLEKKFYYPLQVFKETEKGVLVEYRAGFDAEKDDPDQYKEAIRRLVERGLVSVENYIWVTYGIPFIVPLLAGLVLFLLAGDSIIMGPLIAFLRGYS